MNALVTELKTRARLRLNAVRKGQAEAPQGKSAWRLRDALTLVAREAGFLSWEHALRVLGGHAQPGDDMGSLWHTPACNAFLSHWFADHERGRAYLAISTQSVLLPYRRQYVGVDANYLREIGVPWDDALWQQAGRDLVGAYGSEAWLALYRKRLAAMRSPA